MLGSASCAPGEVGGPGACTGTENSPPGGGGGTSTKGGGSGSGGGNSGSVGKPSGNVAQAVPVVQQKEKCGWFAPVCNGWQRSMEWVHENQDTLGHIAIDLIEIDAGASLITGGATLAAGGGVLEVGSGGLATVIAVPAAAVGVTGVAAGGGLVAHGSWNLGKDVGDLHWNNQASQAGDIAPAAKQGDQGATAEPTMKWEGSPKHGATQRGRANPEPKDPQGSLDRSVPLGPNTTRRVSADPTNNEYSVFDETHPVKVAAACGTKVPRADEHLPRAFPVVERAQPAAEKRSDQERIDRPQGSYPRPGVARARRRAGRQSRVLMSEPMHYESPKPLSKQAAVAVFDKGVPVEVSEALIGLALNEPDWRWVQEVALRYLQGPDEALRMTAATALGHLARLHGTLDLDRVVPALQRLLADPATEGRATDALDDISTFAGGPQPPANRE